MLVEAARDYRQKGWGIVFIRPGEKRPKRHGWTLKSQEPEDYSEGSQLSILTGKLSGDLVCVDLDSPEALRLADSFLPPTPLVDGRPGKPRAHRWYRVVNVPPEMTAKPDVAGGIGGMRTRHFNAAGVDLLATGAQAVAPPSLHPTGEQRAWEDPAAEPATVDAAELVSAVESLARACGWIDSRREARSYVKSIKAIEGAGGDTTTFRVASILLNGFALDREDARDIFIEWNRTNAEPPWEPADLERKLDAAEAKVNADPRFPRGYLIRDGRPNNDPIRLAFLVPGQWVNSNSRFYRYEEGRYVLKSESEMNAYIWRHIDRVYSTDYDRAMKRWERSENPNDQNKPKRRSVKKTEVTATLEALRARCIIPSHYELPCNLKTGERNNWIAFRNGILDLNTFQLLPHSPDWFSLVKLDYDYNPDAVEDRLPGWLSDWFGSDGELISLLQEWCGYLLTPSTDEQSFAVWVGEGSNGKGAASAMVQAVLGEANVSHQTWKGLTERFGLVATQGALLNACDECGEFDRAAEHILKWFTAGQKIRVEEKNLPSFDMTPTARLQVACNSFPRVSDKTAGVYRRMLYFPFTKTIPAEKRIKGMDKPSWWTANANLSGILNWGLAGLKRLRAQGRFTRPRSSEDGKADHRRESNPVVVFFEEYVIPGGWVQGPILYSRYRQWGQENGFQPLSSVAFGREVGRFFPDAQNRSRWVGSEKVRIWEGISLACEIIIPPFQSVPTICISAHEEFGFDDWTEEDAIREARADDLLASA